jgi:energy-coupling factor transporter ATP-binding protein EcfA2
MRLRELRIVGFRALDDVTISFPDPELEYGNVDIRFFAGRNGSGKSTALEALALIFSHLAVGAHPGFDFELDYELGGHDIRLSTMSPDAAGLSLVQAWRKAPGDDDFRPFELGSSNTPLLPDRIIGYSTGPTSGMEVALIDAIHRQVEEIRGEEADEEDEDALEPSDAARSRADALLDDQQALFLDASGSSLAVLAALVSERRRALIEQALEPVGLDADRPLVAFSLQIANGWAELLPEYQHDLVHRLLQLAAIVTKEDDAATHRVAAFDVTDDLLGQLADVVRSPLTFLQTLVTWRRRGVLQRVRLILRKRHVSEPITDEDLSDGELFYLSRYALMLLAAQTRESLLLLDEPETHFNDNWKVDLVNAVAGALRGDESAGAASGHQVIVATHSSLTLTDAEAALIQLFVRKQNTLEVMTPPIPTFGAAPGDLGRLLFGLPAPVGNRAERVLRDALEQDHSAADLERLAGVLGPGYLRLAVQMRLDEIEGD